MGLAGRLGGGIIEKECPGQPWVCTPHHAVAPLYVLGPPTNHGPLPSPVFKERVSSAFLACSEALKLRVGIF